MQIGLDIDDYCYCDSNTPEDCYDCNGVFEGSTDWDYCLFCGGDNEYFDEMFTFLSPLGSDVKELSHSVAIIDVDKEEALDAITGAGFIAKKATDDDHEEIIRELDKLQTIKGGESKRYSRAKK